MSIAVKTVSEEVYNAVFQSFSNCCIIPSFYDDFYDFFLGSSSVIAPMFANTDMAKQKQLLRNGMTMMIQYANDSVTAKIAIKNLSKSHSREQMAIDPKLYPLWVNSLLKAVEKNDPDFTPEVDKAWREVVQVGIDEFISKY